MLVEIAEERRQNEAKAHERRLLRELLQEELLKTEKEKRRNIVSTLSAVYDLCSFSHFPYHWLD